MLTQPDHPNHSDLEGSGDDSERERIDGPRMTSGHSKSNAGEELLFKGVSKSETKSDGRRKDRPLRSDRARMR